MSRKLKKLRQQRRKRQKFIWAISAGLLFLVSAVFIFVENAKRINPELIEVQGRPAIRVDQELIDYGYKTWNTNLTFDITVTNVGDQTLRFSETPYVEVLEGCWPPSLSIGSMALKPGESTKVKSSVFMMHAGMDGPHDFRVHLLTNDPEQPDKEVKVLSNWGPP